MEENAIFGVVIIFIALSLIISTTLWSRKTIDWIAGKGDRSAREIMKDMDNGR